jgi:hypothetical protein
VARLRGIIGRGLRVQGELPKAAVGPWRVTEPAYPHGEGLEAELRRLEVPLSAENPVLDVVVMMTRLPVPADELERLRATCRQRPTVVVGLQNDEFLEDLPEAALRISAADATPLTRTVVAEQLADRLQAAAEARV